jgi:hypothetical protein
MRKTPGRKYLKIAVRPFDKATAAKTALKSSRKRHFCLKKLDKISGATV